MHVCTWVHVHESLCDTCMWVSMRSQSLNVYAGQRSVSSSIPRWTCFNWILGQQLFGIHLSLAPGFKTHTHLMVRFYSAAWNSCSGYRAPRASPCLLNFLFSTRDDNVMIEISFLLSQRVFHKNFLSSTCAFVWSKSNFLPCRGEQSCSAQTETIPEVPSIALL